MSFFSRRLCRIRRETTKAMSATFRLRVPVALFTIFGFARLSNLREMLAAIFICSVAASLSWSIGRAMMNE
jgi:hypothetical protein